MFEINESTAIQRHKNGVKLIEVKKPNLILCEGQRALNIFNFNFNVFFLDQQSAVLAGNESLVVSHHMVSLQDMIGLDATDIIPDRVEALKLQMNDKKVMARETIQFVEEDFHLSDAARHSFISVKIPLYDNENLLMGILGFSTLTDGNLNKITQFLTSLNEAGILGAQEFELLTFPYTPASAKVREFEDETIIFTNRELEILNLASLNLTAKQIARHLNISHRTVECHIDNLKIKVKVNSKKALMEKIFSE